MLYTDRIRSNWTRFEFDLIRIKSKKFGFKSESNQINLIRVRSRFDSDSIRVRSGFDLNLIRIRSDSNSNLELCANSGRNYSYTKFQNRSRKNGFLWNGITKKGMIDTPVLAGIIVWPEL